MNRTIVFRHIFIATLLLVSVVGIAQDQAEEENIKEVGDGACECCYKISVNLSKEKIVEEINSCITQSSIFIQTKAVFMGNKKEETIVVDNDTIVSRNIIIGDKNFEEIQAYMLQNCSAVKQLMASDNEELKYSMSKNKKALAYYEEGIDYAAKEKFDMAIVSYNRAVKIDPKFAFAWDNLGISYRRRGDYKEAIKCYDKSLALDPTGRVPLMSKAVAYSLLKDYKASAETYSKYIELHPEDPEGYFGAGKTYYLNDDYAEGVDNMFKAFKMYSDTKSPYMNDAQQLLASFYNDLKEKNKLEIFNQAAKNNKIDIKE